MAWLGHIDDEKNPEGSCSKQYQVSDRAGSERTKMTLPNFFQTPLPLTSLTKSKENVIKVLTVLP